MKVYVVKHVQEDYISNQWFTSIEKLFDSEEKAINYIINKVQFLIEAKERAKKIQESLKNSKDFVCCRDYCSSCIAYKDNVCWYFADDFTTLNKIPEVEEIKKEHGIVYDISDEGKSSYEYYSKELE